MKDYSGALDWDGDRNAMLDNAIKEFPNKALVQGVVAEMKSAKAVEFHRRIFILETTLLALLSRASK